MYLPFSKLTLARKLAIEKTKLEEALLLNIQHVEHHTMQLKLTQLSLKRNAEMAEALQTGDVARVYQKQDGVWVEQQVSVVNNS